MTYLRAVQVSSALVGGPAVQFEPGGTVPDGPAERPEGHLRTPA